MEYKGFYVTCTVDCEDNLDGYFCQVYKDSNLDYEIDNFCIYREELLKNTIQEIIIDYINQYENDLVGEVI